MINWLVESDKLVLDMNESGIPYTVYIRSYRKPDRFQFNRRNVVPSAAVEIKFDMLCKLLLDKDIRGTSDIHSFHVAVKINLHQRTFMIQC